MIRYAQLIVIAHLLPVALLLLPVRVSGEETAGTVVAASAPLETSVTIYRAPHDGFGNDVDVPEPRRLGGYALISEVREVDLPAGPAVIRLPGVAAGMLAESVVVSGLPGGVREKNLDAQLLSPRHLYAGWFGRPVTLRRTDAHGTTREERAVIRSAPGGAAIVETDHGFEAMTCGPTTDALVYPGVPDGLFATPTLSIATDAPTTMHVRLRVAYLAWDYDWRADYVLKLAPDLRHGTLSAWVTLASADVTSFPRTTAAVVAGRPNFSETRQPGDDTDGGDLTYQCFPRAMVQATPLPAPAPPPAPAPMFVTVTAMRKAAVAEAEDLGDLKLYRLPQPTTIAARARKQVALFAPRTVMLDVLHTAPLDLLGRDVAETDARLTVRTRNRQQAGLGFALPAGHVAVMVERGPRTLLVGQATLTDRAIGDRVDLGLAPAAQVHVAQRVTRKAGRQRFVTVTVSNANAFPVQFLGTFRQTPPVSIRAPSVPLVSEDGHRVWAVQVPAHGRAVLRYHLVNY